MNAAEYEQLTSLFDAASALPESQRERFLQERCPSTPLRERLRRMLASDDSGEDLRASTRVLSSALASAMSPADEEPPPRIGPYSIVRRVAVGGMGVVYLAEQSSPKRTVAVKLLRADIREESLVRHFEREASILARLRHAGIAHVYDAGMVQMASGARPYLVIEYIEGTPIDAFAREKGLGARSIVSLVVQACDAVEHAHARGVVHRDLKPGNLLVTPDGVVKVLDFGIARMVNAGDADLVPSPGAGVGSAAPGVTIPHLLGTLSYMAPEQLEAGGDADTRADVYALGVVLHELLTGRLPIETHRLSLVEAIDAVKRGVAGETIRRDRALAGDLGYIVSTALARDRAKRYASTAALGEDLRRYLMDRPITARPPSLAYAFSKAAKRHRAAFIGLGAAVVLLAVGGPVVAIMAADLARERGERLALAERTLEASRLYEQATDLIQRRVQTDQARSLLDRAIKTNPQFSLAYAARARLDMPTWREMTQARTWAQTRAAVSDLLAAHAAAGGTLPAVGDELAASARVAALRDSIAGRSGFPDALQTAGEALVWTGLYCRPADADQVTGWMADAAACFEQAASSLPDGPRRELALAWRSIAGFERESAWRRLGELAQSPPVDRAESVFRAQGILFGGAYTRAGEDGNAVADAAAEARAWEQVVGRSPGDVEALVLLGSAQRSLREFDAAARTLGRARELAPTDAAIHLKLGWVLRDAGRHAQAAEHFGMAAAMSVPPERAWFLAGECYSLAGQYGQALECMDIHMTAYPADAYALWRYVDLLMSDGQRWEAQAAVDRFAASSDDVPMIAAFQHYVALKASNPAVQLVDVLADDLDRSGTDAEIRLAEAYESVGLYDQASDALQCAIDGEFRSPRAAMRAIGVHLATGDLAQAKEAAAVLLGRDDLSASSWATIARALDGMTLCEEAVSAADRAVELDPEQHDSAMLLAQLLLHCRDTQCQDPDRAVRVLERMAAGRDAPVEMLDLLAESLLRTGRYSEARAAAERGLAKDSTSVVRRLWIAIAASASGDRATANEHYRRAEDAVRARESEAERTAFVETLEPWYSQARAMASQGRGGE